MRQGYATETAQRLLRFGFATLGLHRIIGQCDPRNTASARVLERIGMRYEGHLRDTMLIRDGWRDSLIYSLLEQEWAILHPVP
jgi:ribosomal-protein-alanine N-acetyltransferase